MNIFSLCLTIIIAFTPQLTFSQESSDFLTFTIFNSKNEETCFSLPPINNKEINNNLELSFDQKLELTLPNGTKVSAGACFNNSDTLIILGKGCFNSYRNSNALINLFGEKAQYYDFAATNYRWNNSILSYIKDIKNLGKASFDEEIESVKCLVKTLKNVKSYKKVIALGSCYSAYLFIKAQAACNNKLFDAIIAESVFPGIENIIHKGTQDPLLMANPQKGGLPSCMKKALEYSYLPQIATKLIARLFTYNSILDDLPHITTPLLFIYGTMDKLVTKEDLQITWNKVPNSTQKFRLITPYTHSGHDVDPRIYYDFCSNFINTIAEEHNNLHKQ